MVEPGPGPLDRLLQCFTLAPDGFRELDRPFAGRASTVPSADLAANGGAPVRVAIGDAVKFGASDAVRLLADGRLITEVVYDPSFGGGLGVAAQLDPAAADDDDPASWCPARQIYGDGDLGTPGAPNSGC